MYVYVCVCLIVFMCGLVECQTIYTIPDIGLGSADLLSSIERSKLIPTDFNPYDDWNAILKEKERNFFH